MAHTFTIRPSDEIPSVIGRAKLVSADQGWSFLGNEGNGSFFGKTPLGFIKGEYYCTPEKEIRVTILDKPFLVPYGVIELKIREYFS